MRGEGYDKLWTWFGLSRASWLTLPRVLMHEMPDQWQADMARLLTEFDEAFPNAPAAQTQVRARRGSLPEWLTNYRHPQRSEIDAAR